MVYTRNLVIKAEIQDMNKLAASCEPYSEDFQYAFQLFRNGELVDRIPFSEQNTTVFWLTQSGEYTVRARLLQPENSISGFSAPVQFEHPAVHIPVEKEKKVSLFKKVITIIHEILSHFVMMYRIARYDYKLANKDTYLGKIWSILTPLLQIGTYWLVFGVGIRSGRDIDGHPFLLWMLCGLVPWFFVSHCITKGATSIYSKASTITEMKYPIATVPIGAVIVGLIEQVVVLFIFFFILLLHGYYPTVYYLNLLYYVVYNCIFLSALSLITSVLTMLARDFEKMLSSMVRLLFYLTPILWSMHGMPEIYQDILKFNPILYVVNGFRDSILYEINFWERPLHMAFFWALNLVLLVWGCDLQYKYRKKFKDLS